MPDQQVSAYPRHAIFIRREVEFGEVYFVEDDLISIPALRAGTAAGSADGRGMNRSMNIARMSWLPSFPPTSRVPTRNYTGCP